MTVQFHPAVTYETFVAGISPDVSHSNLRFEVSPGWLSEPRVKPPPNFSCTLTKLIALTSGACSAKPFICLNPVRSERERHAASRCPTARRRHA